MTLVLDADGTTEDAGALPGDADGAVEWMAWSDDGRVALAAHPTAEGAGVYLLDSRGGGGSPDQGAIRLIVDAADPGCTLDAIYGIAWAGLAIVYRPSQEGEAYECQHSRLFRLDPATTAQVPVPGTWGATWWALSPDGGAVAESGDDGTGEGPLLRMADLVSGANRLIGTVGDRRVPAWSPDGRWVLYVDADEGGEQLLASPRDATAGPLKLTVLAPGLERFSHAGWGIDPGTVYFRALRVGCASGCDGFYRLDIDAPASTPTLVAALPDSRANWDTSDGYAFGWSPSPDGTRIAFTVTPEPGAADQVIVVDATGGSAPVVVSEPGVPSRLEGWAAPDLLAYGAADGLVLVRPDGTGRVLIEAPGISSVALRSGTSVTWGL